MKMVSFQEFYLAQIQSYVHLLQDQQVLALILLKKISIPTASDNKYHLLFLSIIFKKAEISPNCNYSNNDSQYNLTFFFDNSVNERFMISMITVFMKHHLLKSVMFPGYITYLLPKMSQRFHYIFQIFSVFPINSGYFLPGQVLFLLKEHLSYPAEPLLLLFFEGHSL